MPDIEIKRGYEVLSDNNVRFGIRVTNNSNSAISDVEVILDYNESLFNLEGHKIQKLSTIPPSVPRTTKFILKPLGCIHKENIGATIIYKDHQWKKHTLEMNPKEVHCVCPFLKEKSIKRADFLTLSKSGFFEERGVNFEGITVEKLVEFISHTCKNRLYKVDEFPIDNGRILYLAGDAVGEKAYYLLTAVVKESEGLTQVLLRANSDKNYGLNGFLNEILDNLLHLVVSASAREIGVIKKEQVINIIDSVVQRSSFSVSEGAPSVNVRDSVVQRTEIKADEERKKREEERGRKEREEQERLRRQKEEEQQAQREKEEQDRRRMEEAAQRQRQEKENQRKAQEVEEQERKAREEREGQRKLEAERQERELQEQRSEEERQRRRNEEIELIKREKEEAAQRQENESQRKLDTERRENSLQEQEEEVERIRSGKENKYSGGEIWFFGVIILLAALALGGYETSISTANMTPSAAVTYSADKKTITNSIGMDFVSIPSGEFNMGSPSYEKDRSISEGPVHHVTISNSFYMGKYEVTQKQWRDVMGTSPSSFKGDNLPVEQVSWNDVQDFIKKLNGYEGGNKYRLPSEAEWEYSARAGTTTRYYFGDDESILGDYAWYSNNSGSTTHEVGQKKPNPWGLYDMHGNVGEWVQDNWHGNYNGAPTDGSSWEDSYNRVTRGGIWNGPAGFGRSAFRSLSGSDFSYGHVGFRLLRIS